jgi:hypothetical protein
MAVLFSALFLFAFVSCSDDGGDDSETETTDEESSREETPTTDEEEEDEETPTTEEEDEEDADRADAEDAVDEGMAGVDMSDDERDCLVDYALDEPDFLDALTATSLDESEAELVVTGLSNCFAEEDFIDAILVSADVDPDLFDLTCLADALDSDDWVAIFSGGGEAPPGLEETFTDCAL